VTEELIIRRSKSVIVFAIFATLMTSTLIYLNSHNFFAGNRPVPHGVFIFFFLPFLAITLSSILMSIDRNPVLRLDEQGIWRRKNFMPGLVRLLAWKTIHYFYIQERTRNATVIQELILRPKESDKDIKINLAGLDTPAETIMEIVRQKAVEYNFHDLGVEGA